MLWGYRDKAICHSGRLYDAFNLRVGIAYAEGRLDDGYTHFPHDSDVDCQGFMEWAQGILERGGIA